MAASPHALRTMLRLNERQRSVVIDKLPDLANIAAGALIFGPWVTGQSASLWLVALGIGLWTMFAVFALYVAGDSDDNRSHD